MIILLVQPCNKSEMRKMMFTDGSLDFTLFSKITCLELTWRVSSVVCKQLPDALEHERGFVFVSIVHAV